MFFKFCDSIINKEEIQCVLKKGLTLYIEFKYEGYITFEFKNLEAINKSFDKLFDILNSKE